MGSKIQTSDFKIKIVLIIFKGKKSSFCDNKKMYTHLNNIIIRDSYKHCFLLYSLAEVNGPTSKDTSV